MLSSKKFIVDGLVLSAFYVMSISYISLPKLSRHIDGGCITHDERISYLKCHVMVINTVDIRLVYDKVDHFTFQHFNPIEFQEKKTGRRHLFRLIGYEYYRNGEKPKPVSKHFFKNDSTGFIPEKVLLGDKNGGFSETFGNYNLPTSDIDKDSLYKFPYLILVPIPLKDKNYVRYLKFFSKKSTIHFSRGVLDDLMKNDINQEEIIKDLMGDSKNTKLLFVSGGSLDPSPPA